MNRDEALKALGSDRPHERLAGANFFVTANGPSDEQVLRQFRHKESDSYVRRRLDLAIAAIAVHSGDALPLSSGSADVEPDSKALYAEAIRWVAGLLAHELEKVVGLVALNASREITGYEGSETKKYVELLKATLEGVGWLKSASSASKPVDFDLAQLLRDITETERASSQIPIALQGPSPFMVRTDPRLLRSAISNGIRNAMEAVAQSDTASPHPIVVNWGKTNIDFWVAVIDQGPGLVGKPEAKFEIGSTSKTGHAGFGLAIARQAMDSVRGKVTLANGAGGGAVFELRWNQVASQ